MVIIYTNNCICCTSNIFLHILNVFYSIINENIYSEWQILCISNTIMGLDINLKGCFKIKLLMFCQSHKVSSKLGYVNWDLSIVLGRQKNILIDNFGIDAK